MATTNQEHKYTVVDAETETEIQRFRTKEEAEEKAKEMTAYHKRQFIAKEVPPYYWE